VNGDPFTAVELLGKKVECPLSLQFIHPLEGKTLNLEVTDKSTMEILITMAKALGFHCVAISALLDNQGRRVLAHDGMVQFR